MLSKKQQICKRVFDIILAAIGIIIFLVPVVIIILLSSLSTKKFGLFSQHRVGQHGALFRMYKIRTMYVDDDDNFITTKDDPRITLFGKFLRQYKLDELPQLCNVFLGNMSLVGPRPDVRGYADQLEGDDVIILTVKPGVTGPATLKFRNEEEILAQQEDPKKYNDTVIWKEKVKINIEYVKKWSFFGDIKLIIQTIFI